MSTMAVMTAKGPLLTLPAHRPGATVLWCGACNRIG
jgi:hypothetical protein